MFAEFQLIIQGMFLNKFIEVLFKVSIIQRKTFDEIIIVSLSASSLGQLKYKGG